MAEDIFHLGVKAFIRDGAGKVLIFMADPAHLIDDATGHWDLPGGRIERGEDQVAALRREIQEETGITDINVVRHLHMGLSNIRIPQREQGSTGLILSVYECTISPAADIVISDEHTHYEWVDPAEAAKRLNHKFSDEFCALVTGL